MEALEGEALRQAWPKKPEPAPEVVRANREGWGMQEATPGATAETPHRGSTKASAGGPHSSLHAFECQHLPHMLPQSRWCQTIPLLHSPKSAQLD